jgi:hypothetical protein
MALPPPFFYPYSSNVLNVSIINCEAEKPPLVKVGNGVLALFPVIMCKRFS